ncbi:transcriptional regulator, TetR family [Parvibaculum lavamentivorans DS-1]|uniref:Transcriptional regulator, TetR family n=1 Tax=Parvibaculum lavamentivorans (strain DS-1 / DSM 13023 / NCIMB 13966) TaxID=402881 RepID=A7HS18_PARL1|nr:TetR/AcrR family transcriptional regulator [Parvibaculum lavamentivorans]ABS62701.1 transcriptional regulator, TetR family [Parvibaculum lavamentivorans DS-1]
MASGSTKKRVRKPVQRRSEATVDTILEAAAQIFRTHGATGATTNRIAERAGVSIGSLYQYFPNKESLLVALMERHIGSSLALLGDVLQAKEGATPKECVHAAVNCVLDIHMEDPELHRVIFEEAPRPPHVYKKFEEGERLMRGALERMLGTFPRSTCRDPKRSAYMSLAMVESMVHRYVTARDKPMLPQAFAAHLTEVVMREMALSSPPSAGSAR